MSEINYSSIHLNFSLHFQLTLYVFHPAYISRASFFLFSCMSLTTLYLLGFCLQGNTIDTEHLSELTEEEYEAQIYQRQDLKGFMWLDAKYLNPFFTRRLTQEADTDEEIQPFDSGVGEVGSTKY
ncbi:hypothetical protein AMECASPLE_028984 [Ameca splendens]|uniref:Uncharacterized protein n=1 Tax=Ameca splendens TaxID=208324 RepID=A0ABV0XUH7_9TELE